MTTVRTYFGFLPFYMYQLLFHCVTDLYSYPQTSSQLRNFISSVNKFCLHPFTTFSIWP